MQFLDFQAACTSNLVQCFFQIIFVNMPYNFFITEKLKSQKILLFFSLLHYVRDLQVQADSKHVLILTVTQ